MDPQLAEWARRIGDFGRMTDTATLRRHRVRLEDKGTIVAFHWRGAPDEAAAVAAVQEIAAGAEAEGLGTHWGRKVLEVRPPVRIDKGAGIEEFLRGTEVRIALYAGDDTTDLDAFSGLTRMLQDGRLDRAVRVGVRSDDGPEEVCEAADLVVDGTEGVRGLLAILISD